MAGFAAPMAELLRDEDERRRLEQPRDDLLAQYTWTHAASLLSALYDGRLPGSRP